MNYAQAKRIAGALESLVEEVRLLREAITPPSPKDSASPPTTTEVVHSHSEKSSAKGGFR